MWQAAVALNIVIAVCYVLIAGLIVQGLVRTRQLTTNALAVATAAIFATCALHHAHHAEHLWLVVGPTADGVRALFGQWHSVLIEVVGAGVAVTYLRLRRSYGALLRTPTMFDDAVRLASERALREMAYTDLLTGVPNRAAYQGLADSLADDPRRATVLLLDLDGFKGVNDAHGHDAGDRVLRDVAQRLQAELGGEAAVYRLGGDEFVLVAMGDEDELVSSLVSRVVRIVRTPTQVRDGTVAVDASVGVATGPASSLDRLLRSADGDMYRSKAARSART